MTQTGREWLINGVLLAGIVFFLVLIGRQSVRESSLEEDLTPAATRESPTTATLPAPRPPRPPSPLGPETAYHADGLAGRRRPASISSDYPDLGKVNLFRQLLTPLPETPSPAPSPPPTPSLEKATETWKLVYKRQSRTKPTKWVLKDTRNESVRITLQEGVPFTVSDGGQDFDISVSAGEGSAVILRYKDQQKIIHR